MLDLHSLGAIDQGDSPVMGLGVFHWCCAGVAGDA